MRGLGAPVRLALTGGQRGDCTQSYGLSDGPSADVVTADAGYDADPLRQASASKGAIAVIPDTPPGAREHRLDKHPCAQRHLIACCFRKPKQFRSVAALAAAILWLR